tara:strand:- start:35 stop:316 length:282 start_codon:yes stop_codon:yes gene_type:complete
MPGRFDDVPTDDDTVVIFREEEKLGDYDVLYEKWTWDGVSAESIIFCSGEVAELSDEEIAAEVKLSPLVDEESDLKVKRSESGYTIVSFNFKI